jgi:SAM-dependent methyltransferase
MHRMPLRSAIRARLHREQFLPTALGPIVNPVFILRNGLLQAIRRVAPQIRGSVLDFGCGSKPYESLFTSAGSYIGCDIEVSGHDHGESKIDVLYDGKRLPFENGSFDAVVSFETFEHVFNLPEILGEINRVTRDGGLLLISIPFGWEEHEIPYDVARYTSYGITSVLTSAGYHVESLQKTTTSVLAIAQMSIAYVSDHLFPRGVIAWILRVTVIFPATMLAFGLNALLPKRHEFYCNVVVLAKKIG